MIKIILRTGLLALVLLLASKAYIALMAYQSISQIKDSHQQTFLLTYQWISSDLNGTVSVEGIEFTPYLLKRTFYIDRLDLEFDNYLALISSLSEVFSGNFSALKSLTMPEVRTELKGRSFQDWFAREYPALWLKPFGLFGCGEPQGLSVEQFKKMGLSEIQGSVNLTFSRTETLQDQFMLSVDLKELGRFRVTTQWLDNSLHQAIIQQSIEPLRLSAINLNHQEAGLFRRLNVICNPSESKERSIFSALTANAWKQALDEHGLIVNQPVLDSYREYLLRGGKITLDADFGKSFKLAAYKSLLDQELFGYFSATLSLNGQRIEKPELFVDRMIIDPPPVVPDTQTESLEVPKPEPGYRQVAIEQLADYVGHRIRVVMADQKDYEGRLNAVTEYNLDLIRNLPGGRVSYPLMLNEIETVEIWFNTEAHPAPAER